MAVLEGLKEAVSGVFLVCIPPRSGATGLGRAQPPEANVQRINVNIQGLKLSRSHVWVSYVRPTVGILLLLLALYGINVVMSMTPVLIPASVICMLILFIGLLVLEQVVGTRRTSSVLAVVNIPAGFSLKWINVCFTSPFILLPLAQRVSVSEAFEIGAVVVLGYIVMAVFYGYIAWGLQKVTGSRRRVAYEEVGLVELDLSGSRGESSAIGGGGEREGSERDESEREERGGEEIGIGESSRGESRGERSEEIDKENVITTDVPGDDISIASQTSSPIVPQRVAPITRLSMSVPQSSPDLQFNSQREPQQPHPLSHNIVIANWIAGNFDWLVYSILLIIGVIVYYSIDYSLFLDLSVVVLSYRCGLLVPAKYRLVIHPILVCSGISIFTIFITGRINSESLTTRLEKFKTGRNYLTLFSYPPSIIPGAGDILSTLLDVSIVSLAVPMYQYRTDLKRHFIVLIVSTLLAGVTSFFIYPPLCYAIGISQTRSLAFIARSATLALALPVVEAVGGSTSLVAVVTILSGIFGVLFGNLLMGSQGLRLRQDDYVTRGIIMGLCSGAIGSVHLLNIDPRSSAISSLSFFLYGIILIVMAVIPPIRNIVREWVNLPPI